jgi:hypothetical protein
MYIICIVLIGTYHESDQPAHLRVKEGMENIPSSKLFITINILLLYTNNILSYI